MFLQNSISIKRRFFLLFIFFTSTLFASYHPIYDVENPEFEYAIENGDYKVYLTQEGSIDYNNISGFELFLPNFLKEYNLGVLRFNSIGSIDGVLSIKENDTLSTNKIAIDDIRYYLTDYSTVNQRQLDYLLKNEKIPYLNKTSLAFQGYNIPNNISKNLNKSIFFSFLDKTNDNKLATLVYSYSMVLDKKVVDSYVKKHKKIRKFEKDSRFDLIYTYLSSFGTTKEYQSKNSKSLIKEEPSIENKKEEPLKINDVLQYNLKLDLVRDLEMKDFEYSQDILMQDISQNDTNNQYSIEENYKELQKSLDKLISIIEKMKDGDKPFATNVLNKSNNSHKNLTELIREKDILIGKMSNVEFDRAIIMEQKCDGGAEVFRKSCLEEEHYFDSFIYHALKRGRLPSEELIIKNGNTQTLNRIGKYYYDLKEYQKSEKYLLRAYEKISKIDKEIVAYNLGVLYAKLNSTQSHKKSISYFEKTTFKEAYFNLGINYYIGLGVKENNSIAYEYFSKSAQRGFEKSELNVLKMQKLYPYLFKNNTQ